MTAHPGPSIADIKAQLAAQAQSLVNDLLPGGQPEQGGRLWRCGDVSGVAGQSMVVWLSGAKAGEWHDFGAAQGGDLIDLVAAHHGLDKGRAISWCKDWLGISEKTGRPTKQRRTGGVAARAPKHRERDSDLRGRQAKALALWHDALPARGTIVEAYLRGRGITTAIPETLRLAPLLKHPPSGAVLPAMLACVQHRDGAAFATVHRTWLDLPGFDHVGPSLALTRSAVAGLGAGVPCIRARLEPPRMAFGGIPYHGGVVRFGRCGETLAIGEGIETMLSVRQARPGWTCWSAVSITNIKNVWLPPMVRSLQLCFDGDDPGSPAASAARRAAEQLAAQLQATGRQLAITVCPAPVGKDFNDLGQLPGDQPSRPQAIPEL